MMIQLADRLSLIGRFKRTWKFSILTSSYRLWSPQFPDYLTLHPEDGFPFPSIHSHGRNESDLCRFGHNEIYREDLRHGIFNHGDGHDIPRKTEFCGTANVGEVEPDGYFQIPLDGEEKFAQLQPQGAQPHAGQPIVWRSSPAACSLANSLTDKLTWNRYYRTIAALLLGARQPMASTEQPEGFRDEADITAEAATNATADAPTETGASPASVTAQENAEELNAAITTAADFWRTLLEGVEPIAQFPGATPDALQDATSTELPQPIVHGCSVTASDLVALTARFKVQMPSVLQLAWALTQ
eukprot:jgi/Hompol1/4129/HPOL_006934-RA